MCFLHVLIYKWVMLVGGLHLSRSQQQVKVQILKIPLNFLRRFVIQRNKYLGVNITKEIASSVLLAVASFLHAGSAMIKSATIQWIGNFVPHTVGGLLYIVFNINSLAGRLQLKWCVCAAWKSSLLDQCAQLLPVVDSQWQSTIAAFANFLMMKGRLQHIFILYFLLVKSLSVCVSRFWLPCLFKKNIIFFFKFFKYSSVETCVK